LICYGFETYKVRQAGVNLKPIGINHRDTETQLKQSKAVSLCLCG